MTDRTYLLAVTSEPTEEPVVITQDLFDNILDRGLRATEALAATGAPEGPREADVDFAEITTSDEGPFLHHGQPQDETVIGPLFQLGFSDLLNDALDVLSARTSQQ